MQEESLISLDPRDSPETDTLDDYADAHTPHDLSSLWKLWRQLVIGLRAKVPLVPVQQIGEELVSVFFQRSFPSLPICHEPTLRKHVEYFLDLSSDSDLSIPDVSADMNPIQLMRSFSLLTAVCATMAFLHGTYTILYGRAIAPLFLRSSREMLRVYEDYDVEHPNSSSLQIRMLLSTCHQQHTGDLGLSRHMVGQASLLARSMRLHNELSVSRYDPLESTMLRFSFWILHTANCTALCTQDRAVVLHEPIFDTELDLEDFGSNHVSLLDEKNPYSQNGYERLILEGFHRIHRNMLLASRVLHAIRTYARANSHRGQIFDSQPELAHITNFYSEYIASLDDLPTPLQLSFIATSAYDAFTEPQPPCFTSQRYRLLSMYHSSKLMIIHECEHYGLAAAIGLQNDESTLAIEMITTARDFIHNLQSVPFHYLQANGEPGVELIRVVGSVLLEITQRSMSNACGQRAQSLLEVLLNILAKLNSRASDALITQLSQEGNVSLGTLSVSSS